MPLHPCSDCGNENSHIAVICTKCGRPLAIGTTTEPHARENRGRVFVAILIGLAAVGILIWTSLWSGGSDGLSAKQQTAVNDALKALRKIEAATQVDSSFAQYQQLVLEAKASINEAGSVLPDAKLKTEFNSSIEAYRDAGVAWDVSNKGLLVRSDQEPGKTLSTKYELKMLTGDEAEKAAIYIELGRALNEIGKNRAYAKTNPPNSITKQIFTIAKSHVDRASTLVSH